MIPKLTCLCFFRHELPRIFHEFVDEAFLRFVDGVFMKLWRISAFFSYFCSDEHCLENKDLLKHENSKNISTYRLSFDCVVRY